MNHFDDVVYLVLPLSNTVNEKFQMLSAQISWHDPVDLHGLINFIDGTLNEFETHCFHDKHLDIFLVNFASLADLSKREASFILTALKE